MFNKALVIAAVLILAIAATAYSQGEWEVGRYELFMGEYKVKTLNGEISYTKELFKVDTKTGAVWVLLQTDLGRGPDGPLAIKREWVNILGTFDLRPYED